MILRKGTGLRTGTRSKAVILLGWLAAVPVPGRESVPIIFYTLDEIRDGNVRDEASGTADAFSGNFRLIPGVAGRAVKFDGFTTVIRKKAAEAPALSEAFTVEAWIALGAYPWNWCGVVSQQSDQKAGYALEVGPLGELGLKLFAGGEWRECLSREKIPLRNWTHIAGTYDRARGLAIYLDGRPAGELRPAGDFQPAAGADLIVGSNHEKRKAAFIHREFGTLPAWYSLDAALDNVAVFDRALPAVRFAEVAAGQRPSAAPVIPPRVLPAGPASPGPFGAVYTKLDYYWEWDDLFRVAERPDVVVRFDGSPVRVVFWRGTRYSPAWVTENNLWMADQSVEAWNNVEGCFEHMQDPKCLYSHVRVIENTPARAVVHWRYAPVSAYNHLWNVDERTGWALWIDEVYYFYPDRTGIRRVTWQKNSLGSPSQFQESIPLASPGQLQGDVVNVDYVTVANLQGEKVVFSYVKDPPKETTKPVPAEPSIQMHNLKAANKPFIIFEPGSRMRYLRDMNIDNLSKPGSCNHWPEGQIPCDGRTGRTADRATSFLGFPITYPVRHAGERREWVNFLYGMTAEPFDGILPLARSWSRPPDLKVVSGGMKSEGYDRAQRAYVLRNPAGARPGPFELAFAASAESPIHNLCLVLKDWNADAAAVALDERPLAPGDGLRIGALPTLDGTDLVVWIETKSVRPIRIAVTPAGS
ncbi:MAG: LamG domain-containing protein [Candidatus Aminicenantes bacterium]|nr:LamG domain-containing protein [Candidatus Aminicenantes bacterium]